MIARFFISLTLGVFVTTYIIRALSVEDYGVYNVLISMIGYVGVFSALGIPATLQRFIPESLEKKEFALLKKLVVRGALLRLALAVLAVAIVLFYEEPIGSLFKLDNLADYSILFAVGAVFFLESQLLTFVLGSVFLHKYMVISSTLYTVVRAGAVYAVLHYELGLKGLLLGEAVAWFLWCALLLGFYYFKFVRRHPSQDNPALPLKRYLRYGGYSSLNDLGGSVLGVSTDFLIITAFLGPSAVALYAFADKVLKMLVRCMPHILLIEVIRPAFFAKYSNSGDKKILGEMFNMLLKLGAFTIYPLAAGLMVVGDQLVVLAFKAEYLDAIPILSVLAIFTAINIFFQPIGLVIKALEKVQYQLYSKIFAVYNIVGALLVVREHGVMGVVLVTCSAALFKNAFLFYFVKKNVDFSVDWMGLLRVLINTLIMSAVLVVLKPYMDSLFMLFALTFVAGLVYLAACAVNRAFRVRERDWINAMLPKPVFLFY